MTSKIDDGGYAFPTTAICTPDGRVLAGPSDGMSMRDWFAGQAIVGLGTWMPVPASGMPSLHANDTLLERARIAYRQADAMIAARKGGAA